MPNISVKDQIKKLVELQKVDALIYDYNQELEDKPAALEIIKQEFESKKAHLHELEESLKQTQLTRKELELALKEKEEGISKANAKLSDLKTNKEYSAMISEIENIKADKSIIEEKILNSYDQSDEFQKQIDDEKKVVEVEERTYLQQKKEVEESVNKINNEIKTLKENRSSITPDIDPNVLSRYERILTNKMGLAIAPVVGQSCGGCNMNLNPQKINSIRICDEIVECEFCARILFIEEDL